MSGVAQRHVPRALAGPHHKVDLKVQFLKVDVKVQFSPRRIPCGL